MDEAAGGAGCLDARGDTPEGGGQVLDVGRRFQRHREQRLELIVGVQRDQGSSQGAELGDEAVTQQRPGPVLPPQLAELRDARDGMGGDEGAVDAADRGTQHEIRPDARPRQRGQHAHLGGAEQPAASQDEGDGMLDRARRI